jgi:lysophospholipase L1-like esterase
MSVRLNNRGIILFFSLISVSTIHSQYHDFPYEIPKYDFIHYDSNRFQFDGDSSSYQHFLAKFGRLIREGTGQISIVHIGGSHLQADIYTDRIRTRFQTFQPGNIGGRGFIFPYSVAKTNNPPNYKVSYTGRWSTCKNTQEKKKCPLGLSGISVTTRDTAASISISFPASNAIPYDFNRIKIFYLADSLSFDCTVHSSSTVTFTDTTNPGCITVELDSYSDSLIFSLYKTSNPQLRFTLLGISLETDDPGVIYHAAGVNGAKVPSFLKCSLLSDHLACLSADLVVLSLGTNDAYTRHFNAASYRQNYDTLIRRIRTALPGAAILITVPNDSYLYRRYTNPNTEKVRDMILDLAEEHNCGVWDFYRIMGGLNAIIVWQRFGLAKRDRIHFTRKGYLLKGDLFFNAFLKSYDDFIDKKPLE